MTRKLPWKRVRTTARQDRTGPKVPLHPTNAGCGSAASPGPPARGRSPSTSPPPAPPAEKFMIDGVDADDAYRMVEDEFLSVAGTFTAHLHKAEYRRLKSLAKDRNAAAIRSISRPVTGDTTETVRRRKAAERLVARQVAGIKQARGEIASGADDDDDHSDDDLGSPWAGTALQGLMDSTRRKAVPLSAIIRSAAAASERDVVSTTSSARLPSVPPRAHSHAGANLVSSAKPAEMTGCNSTVVATARYGHDGPLDMGLTDDDDDDDLDAPSSYAARQHNNRQCQQLAAGHQCQDAALVARVMPTPLAAAGGSASGTVHASRIASSEEDQAAPGPGTPCALLRTPADRSTGSSAVDGHGGDEDECEDLGILRRIRERRKRRGKTQRDGAPGGVTRPSWQG